MDMTKDSAKTLSFTCPQEMQEKIRSMAKENNIPLSTLIRGFVIKGMTVQ